jgi:hypothetical protein
MGLASLVVIHKIYIINTHIIISLKIILRKRLEKKTLLLVIIVKISDMEIISKNAPDTELMDVELIRN